MDRPTDLARRTLLGAAGAIALPAFVRHARAADVERFALGVASGQPRPDRLVLWTRLTGAGLPERVEVRWELAHDEAFAQSAARGTEIAEVGTAHSVHAEPAGLAPGRGYFYRFEALGQRSRVGRTRTAPAPDAEATLQFAIASCQRFESGHYAAWAHAAREPLDLVMFLGDYIYEYAGRAGGVRSVEGGTVTTLEQYRARYATYKSDPSLQAAHAACPWLVIWDDHEVENDYAGLRGSGLLGDLTRQRAAAYQAWWEHQPVPKAARPVGPDMRIHDRFEWGRLARIHTLDDRQHRDEQVCRRPLSRSAGSVRPSECPELRDPRRTLLGAAQMRWLTEGWDLDRPWNLVAQQTLMARFIWGPPGDTPVWTDGWDGYAPERARLLGSVAARRVPGVVVLGGDVHAHHVADLKADFDDPHAPVVASEFCGTSISSPGPAQARLDAAREHHPHVRHARAEQRGYVRFALDARQLDARLMAVRDAEDPQSAVDVQARFVVAAGHPGPQPA